MEFQGSWGHPPPKKREKNSCISFIFLLFFILFFTILGLRFLLGQNVKKIFTLFGFEEKVHKEIFLWVLVIVDLNCFL